MTLRDRLAARLPRRALAALLALLLGGGLAVYIRFGLVERQLVALACDGGEASFACGLRALAIQLFHYEILGWSALAAGLATLLRPRWWSAALTLFAGGLGLFLYNTELAATGITLALLALARSEAGAAAGPRRASPQEA
jgi:hypothetical protein